MYCHRYNLNQLLELALRVPEVGAVNFNILYYIIKTIIQEKGLEEVKPVFSFEAESIITKAQLKKVSLRRSYSAGSVKDIDAAEVTKQAENDEEYPEEDLLKTREKESLKWSKIKNNKRLDAIEDEITDVHRLLDKLVDKISNLEKVSRLQESKFKKEIADVHLLMDSKLKDIDLTHNKEFEEIVTNVAYLMENDKSGESKKSINTSEKKDNEEPGTQFKHTVGTVDKPTVSDTNLRKTKSSSEFEKKNFDDSTIKPGMEKSPESTLKKSKMRLPGDILDEKKIEIAKDPKLSDETTKLEEIFSVPPKGSSEMPKKKVDPEIVSLLKKKSEPALIPEASRKHEEDPKSTSDIQKFESQLLKITLELRKLMDKFYVLEKAYKADKKALKGKKSSFEDSDFHEQLRLLKVDFDGMVHIIENTNESLKNLEAQVILTTGFPAVQKRLEELEAYVYSESETKPKQDYSTSVTTVAKEIKKPEPPDIDPQTEKRKEVLEEKDEKLSPSTAHKHFIAAVDVVAVSNNMQMKKDAKFDKKDLHKFPEPEKYPSEDLKEDIIIVPEVNDYLEELPLVPEKAKDYLEEEVKNITFTSPDVREEYSLQTKGQIIVFVKKRLHDFEMELQHVKGDVTTTKKKVGYIEKHLKDLTEKLQFLDANFNQRSADFVALRQTAENHQILIVTIMHHLDRKAEAYAVNQKVNREELTVIEDRILKLCAAASSEMTKLEEKIDISHDKFYFELSKKLFIDEFECRVDFLLHKIKMFENKLKDLSAGSPVLDFEGIRPVEIKKYLLSKDGMKIKHSQKITSKTKSSPDVFIPVVTQHHTEREFSPKTALQIQKELELASYRESKRYVQGAHTKIKAGKK